MTGVREADDRARLGEAPVSIESISAITLATHDMARSVRFYRALGFELRYGGEEAAFTSLAVGSSYLNICTCAPGSTISWWGRVILYVSDVDALYARALARGLTPQFAPRDATWGERYFHLTDPDGHELSFARPLPHER
jgi:catechol 2,3-dioxygenase-like lactoylglutathione lyase family enzyme